MAGGEDIARLEVLLTGLAEKVSDLAAVCRQNSEDIHRLTVVVERQSTELAEHRAAQTERTRARDAQMDRFDSRVAKLEQSGMSLAASAFAVLATAGNVAWQLAKGGK